MWKLWVESSGDLRQILFCSLGLRSAPIETSGYVLSLTLLNCCVNSAKLEASKGLEPLKGGDI